MVATRTYDAWMGHNVYDINGDKIGEIKDIFYDDATQRPEWLAVKTGLLAGNSFIPIQGATVFGDSEDLQVVYTKDYVKDAPNTDADTHLSPDEERMLWSYYKYDYDTTTAGTGYGYGESYATNPRVDADYESGWPGVEGAPGGEIVAEATAVTEQVIKEAVPNTVRLRKYRWTEQVPVQHEEVRVEQVPAEEPVQTPRNA